MLGLWLMIRVWGLRRDNSGRTPIWQQHTEGWQNMAQPKVGAGAWVRVCHIFAGNNTSVNINHISGRVTRKHKAF